MAGTGVGVSRCALFDEINARDPRWARDNYLSWAQGFMAGLNYERIREKKPTVIVNALTDDELWARLMSYCAANPNDRFAEGAFAQYLSLPTKPPGR